MGIERLPRSVRKKLLVVIVAIGALGAVALWGFTITGRFTPKVTDPSLDAAAAAQQQGSIFSQIKRVFSGLKADHTALDQAAEEYKKNNN